MRYRIEYTGGRSGVLADNRTELIRQIKAAVPLLLYFSEKPYPIFTPISTPIHHFYHDKKTNRQISQDKQYTAVFSAKISLFLSLLTNHDNACQNAVHNKKCTAESLPETLYNVCLESLSYSGLPEPD